MVATRLSLRRYLPRIPFYLHGSSRRLPLLNDLHTTSPPTSSRSSSLETTSKGRSSGRKPPTETSTNRFDEASLPRSSSSSPPSATDLPSQILLKPTSTACSSSNLGFTSGSSSEPLGSMAVRPCASSSLIASPLPLHDYPPTSTSKTFESSNSNPTRSWTQATAPAPLHPSPPLVYNLESTTSSATYQDPSISIPSPSSSTRQSSTKALAARSSPSNRIPSSSPSSTPPNSSQASFQARGSKKTPTSETSPSSSLGQQQRSSQVGRVSNRSSFNLSTCSAPRTTSAGWIPTRSRTSVSSSSA